MAQPHELACPAADRLAVSGAEALSDGDGKAGADAQGEAQHKEVERSGGADCGKGVDAQNTPDDDAVGQIIKLLKQVAHQQRRAESQNSGQRRTCSHVSCHKDSSFRDEAGEAAPYGARSGKPA